MTSPRQAFDLVRPIPEELSPPLSLVSDTYLLPLYRLPERLTNLKVKWPKECYCLESYADIQMSKLYDRDGTCFVITQSIKRGSEGKLRFAWRQDELTWLHAPRRLAAKEWHHQPPRTREGGEAHKTATVSRAKVRQEIDRTIFCQDIVNTVEGCYDRLPPHHDQSLLKARAHAINMGVDVFIETESRSYMLMPRATTSLSSFLAGLHPDLRPYAATNFWAQIVTNLEALHEDGAVVHHDVAPSNIVIFPNAQVRLVDFGGATMEHEPNEQKKGIISTLVPPEAVMIHKKTGALAELGAAADVFCAAASLVGSYEKPFRHNLFLHSNVLPAFPSKQQYFSCLFQAMKRWLVGVTEPSTQRATASRILAGPDCMFKDFFRPMAQGNPNLCEILVNDAMALQPKNRLSAMALGFQARSQLPHNPEALDRLTAAIEGLEVERKMERLTEAARQYNAWEIAMRAGLGGKCDKPVKNW